MTEAQDHARRINAQKSTGPKTEEGKMNSRMNAMKHGLTSQILKDEELPEQENQDTGYEDILDNLITHYKPETPIEEMLIKRIALLNWRLHRISVAEQKSLQSVPGMTYSLPPAGAMERILKYERTMDRELHRTINQLERLRVKKNTNEPEIERE